MKTYTSILTSDREKSVYEEQGKIYLGREGRGHYHDDQTQWCITITLWISCVEPTYKYILYNSVYFLL